MAGKVITVTSGKGGVGKTTLVANLAVSLAMQGQRVVAIDADVGLRNLDVALGLENRIVYDLVDVIEGRCRLRQSLIRDKRLPELFLIPAAQARDKSAVRPEHMLQVCSRLREQHDYVLIDSPAGIEEGFRCAIAPSDEIIVITNAEVGAVRAADRVIGLVEAGEKGPARLVINRVRPEFMRRGEMLDVADVVELLAIELIGVVPEDSGVLVAANRGRPLTLSTNGFRAGQAFHNIAHRLQGEDVPFLPLRGPGVLRRILGLVHSREDRS